MIANAHLLRPIAGVLFLVLSVPATSAVNLPKIPSIPGFPKRTTESSAAAKASEGPPASPVDQLARRDVVNSAVTGAVVGAVLGGVIANNVGDGKEERGILIGAGLGAMLGAGLGDIAAQRRKAYASESKYLEAEIASANAAISTKEKEITAVQMDLAETNNQIARLEEQRRNNVNISAEARAKRIELDKQISGYDDTLKTYEGSIEFLNRSLSSSLEKKAATVAERQELESLQTDLLARRNDLSKQFAQLNGHRKNVDQSRDRLLAME